MSLFSSRLVYLLLVCAAITGITFSATSQAETPTLDPRVATELLDAYEMVEEDEYEDALRALNRLMERRGEGMKAFDRASVLQIRGSVQSSLENYSGALTDFRAALRLDALPSDQQSRLRLNIAQLYFVTEQFEESLAFFEEWLSGDHADVDHNIYFMLAAANYQLENYRDALGPIGRAIEMSPEPTRRYYDLKNVLLSNLEMTAERTDHVKKMVELWPAELPYWRQLASLYLEQDEQFKSFSTLETAYRNGLISDQSDIVLLAQYYSTFNNPHRGAELIEKEMDAGRVETNVRHLQLLSQLWSQAREHRKAIPVLREAAELSDDGMLFFRLGQALMADERNEQAQDAFESAIEEGGLEDETLAEAWLLLGNARFNQAGPGDREQRRLADEAFVQAERHASTRSQARDWRGYIQAIDETETRQALLEQEQQERLAEAAEERMITGCRAQQLAGTRLSEECIRVLGLDEEGREAGN